jgi:broad specificity phosphatase PhoE
MTTFYLIRHAEREGGAELLAGRMPGLHLTPDGRAQARRIARRLAGDPISRVVSSPLERTRETAAPLARARGVDVEICDAIGEIDAGDWTGKTFPELEREERWRQFNRFRSATRIPNGDTIGGVQDRFVREMLRWRDLHGDGHLALVSHADPIRVALAYFLGLSVDLSERIEIGLGSISIVAIDGWGAKVLRLNDVP